MPNEGGAHHSGSKVSDSMRLAFSGVPGILSSSRKQEKPMTLSPGHLIGYLGNAVDDWLRMEYHENENGEPSPLLAGVGRAD